MYQELYRYFKVEVRLPLREHADWGGLRPRVSLSTGGARVTRQVYTLRYQGELLGLWDPQNRVIYVDRVVLRSGRPAGSQITAFEN